MSRLFVAAVVAFAVLWQSLPLARIGVVQGGLADVAHVALHWADASHHHHDDGTFHFDDSAASAQHMIADQFNSSATIASETVPASALQGSYRPHPADASGLPAPYLESPLRPPRALT